MIDIVYLNEFIEQEMDFHQVLKKRNLFQKLFHIPKDWIY
jgi:hypothetical protein